MQREVKKNFNRVAINGSYDNFAFIQKDSAKLLVEMFFDFLEHQDSYNIEKILDIGVGTGFVVESLLQKYQNGFYHLNDISEEMLRVASTKFKNNNYSLIYGDIEKIKLDNSYDLIISNFSFQWMNDLKKLLKDIINEKKTRYLVFTTLVDNNFQEITKLFQKYKIDTLNYFLSDDLDDLLNHQKIARFSSRKKTYDLYFENFFEYAKYIKNIGANFIKKNSQNLKKILQNENTSINLNYEVYFCCVKVF